MVHVEINKLKLLSNGCWFPIDLKMHNFQIEFGLRNPVSDHVSCLSSLTIKLKNAQLKVKAAHMSNRSPLQKQAAVSE